MPRPLKRDILGASTIILSKDIDKYAFMRGSNFYETNVTFYNFTLIVSEIILKLVHCVYQNDVFFFFIF